MYFAVTRARHRLYVSHAQTRMLHGQTRYCMASSFLKEIPENLLKLLNRRQDNSFAARPAWSDAPVRSAPAYTTSAHDSGGSSFRIGQVVEHAKFGQGIIVAAEGRGPDARVQVNFGANNMKWLALEYAKLTPV
jgi:DNA helicase II / ATP-dependent DNA helicase PcrA